ncbi:hypothetical protein [Planktothrix mougeotii]|uniref:Uncharacterized protein n=1 Tax=Planktothrix mougeotii LEGE 06226 TaxID=1828728 RepID=A0ABR9U609_9CYAN|nr:hypothetical protein [Planktothrix mougeotii]MBE9141892.1 hypothetical protein [Planktothrix mougeotii LEGE 06226]
MSIRQNIAIATNSNSKKVIVTINIDIIFDHRIFVSREMSENVGNLMSDIVGKCRKMSEKFLHLSRIWIFKRF